MSLYELTDYAPGGSCDQPEDYNWLLVWAENEADAMELAGRTDDWTIRPVETTATPAKEGRHIEGRLNVMRQLGWCEPGERQCESCGMYALGMERYEVCDDCEMCRECGCECDDESEATP